MYTENAKKRNTLLTCPLTLNQAHFTSGERGRDLTPHRRLKLTNHGNDGGCHLHNTIDRWIWTSSLLYAALTEWERSWVKKLTAAFEIQKQRASASAHSSSKHSSGLEGPTPRLRVLTRELGSPSSQAVVPL